MDISQTLSDSGTYGFEAGQPTAHRVPLLPLLSSVVFRITSPGVARTCVQLFNRIALMAGLFLVCLAIHGKRAWLGKYTLLLLFLGDPYFYHQANALNQTAGAFFFNGLLLFIFSRTDVPSDVSSRHAGLHAALFGVVFALATLFRQTFLIVFAVYCAWLIVNGRTKVLAVTLLVFCLAMSPWWIRNFATFQRFTVTDTGVSSLVVGAYNDKTFNELEAMEQGWVGAENAAPIPGNEWDAYDFYPRYLLNFLRQQSLFRTGHVVSTRVFRFFFPYCHFPRESLIFVPFFLLLSVINFFFFWGGFRAADDYIRNGSKAWAVKNPLLLYSLLAMGANLVLTVVFYTNPRLLFPFRPCVYILAGYGFKPFLERGMDRMRSLRTSGLLAGADNQEGR